MSNNPVVMANMDMLSSISNRSNVDRGSYSKTRSSAVPSHSEYIPAIEKGVREASDTGVLAGYPMVDVKVTLVDGSFHEVDSSEMAFKMAGLFAFKEAMQKGAPVLLEPIMKVEVVVAGRISWRYSGSDQFQTRNHSWNGSPPGKCTCCPVQYSSFRDVRIRNRTALRNPGSRRLYHGI